MKTVKLDRCPTQRYVEQKENPMALLIKEFAESDDPYHQVVIDDDDGEQDYEKVAQRLRTTIKKLKMDDRIVAHHTFSYDDKGERSGRIVWLENTEKVLCTLLNREEE